MEKIKKEILRLEDAWIKAEQNGDTTFLKDLLSDDFIGINPKGTMLTKKDWLDQHISGDLKYDSLVLNQNIVRVYNGTSILTAREINHGSYKGERVNEQYRVTLVFIEQRHMWQLSGIQLSTLRQNSHVS